MIVADDPRIVKNHNNIAIILLVLFIPYDQLQLLFRDIGIIDDDYSLFNWANWYLCYLILNNYVKYYTTNILQMRKSKIDIYKLVTRNNYTNSSKKNVMEQNNLLKPSNTLVNNKDKQYF